MTFKKTPTISIPASITLNPQGIASLPWAGTIERDYKWVIDLEITPQTQSSDATRQAFQYNGQDVSVGQWIANTTAGTAWQITAINSKTTSLVTAVVEDIYRYNTFRDPSANGNGAPIVGQYVIFDVFDDGFPAIDPVPNTGISADFTMNLQSRFQYINLQFNYPLSQPDGSLVTFVYNDVIAVDVTNNKFVRSDATNKRVIGRVTSVNTTQDVFTINPVQKIVDTLDVLPGLVGDTIYSSVIDPGQLSLDPAGSEVYIKLRNNTQSVTYSGDFLLAVPVTTPGNVFRLNDIPITVSGTGLMSDIVSDVNAVSLTTGVVASIAVPETVAVTDPGLVFYYGQFGLDTTVPATATINGEPVTFDISVDGMILYGLPIATPKDMSDAIDRENIPGIVTTYNTTTLTIIDTSGMSINIINISPDTNGCNFAGPMSGSAIPLFTPAGVFRAIKFLAVDARSIDFYDEVGTTTLDAELESAENGVKAAGLYVADGLRKSSSTVVSTIPQLNALTPMIGDQAFVLDSEDATGNNAGEWSMWLYDGASWVQTSNKDSSTTDAKSLELLLDFTSPTTNVIGSLSNGRRVSLITVDIVVPFANDAILDLGYRLDYPLVPVTVPDGLMTTDMMDLTTVGTYSTLSDFRFDFNTDISLVATLSSGSSITGEARIIITYV